LYNINKLESIPALILVGGFGKRLRSLTKNLPKVLINVRGNPFLHYILEYLHDQGIREVILCTGYKAQEINNYCGDGSKWNLQIAYSSEDQALGTGGAIYNARNMIKSNTFLVLNGDSLFRIDLNSLLDFHVKSMSKISICLTMVDNIKRFGSININPNGTITEFVEKGKSGAGFINAGTYLIEREVFSRFPRKKVISLEYDIFPDFVHKGLYGKLFKGAFLDIGTPRSLENVNKMIN